MNSSSSTRLERALGLGHLEQGGGVGVGAVGHDRPCRPAPAELVVELGDVLVDQGQVAVAVEVGADDLLGQLDGEVAHLALQLAMARSWAACDVGRVALPELGHLRLGPPHHVLAQLLGGLAGLLDDPVGLVLGVGQLALVLGQDLLGLVAPFSASSRLLRISRCGPPSPC